MPFDGYALQPTLLGRATTGEPVLNRLHPLAHKLKKAFVFNRNFAARELVSLDPREVTKENTGTGGEIEGEGMRLVGTWGGSDDDYFRLWDDGEFDLKDTWPNSFSLGFTIDTINSTAANGDSYLGATPGAAVTLSPIVRAVYYSTDGNYYISAGFQQGGSWGNWTEFASGSGITAANGERINLTVTGDETAATASEIKAYKNQEPVEDTGVGPRLRTDQLCDDGGCLNLNAKTGHRTHYSGNGWYRYFYLWTNRLLTADEAYAINANPYAPFGVPLILDSSVPIIPWQAAAAATATPKNPFGHPFHGPFAGPIG